MCFLWALQFVEDGSIHFDQDLRRRLRWKNVSAVKYVLNTAISLTIGSLLEYGEWEVLTVFAAFLGPAECKFLNLFYLCMI